jgi:putative tricarboxylic transport membrane protein
MFAWGSRLPAMLGLVAALVLCGISSEVYAEYPERAITIVVPAAAGGRTDTTARVIQKSIEKNHLLPVPIAVINVPGAGNLIANRQVKDEEPDGYTYLLGAYNVLTLAATGVADFGPEAFAPVASVTSSPAVYAVPEDSPYQTLEELLEAAREKPNTLLEAQNIGGGGHFISLVLRDAAGGAEVRQVQTGGGAEKLNALLGHHADVAVFALSEYVTYKDSGIRALVQTGEERDPKAPDVPTAKELGIDMVWSSPRWFLAPKGTPRERIDVFAEAVEKAMQDPEVIETFEKQAIAPTYQGPDEFAAGIPPIYESIKAAAAKIEQ